MTTWFRRIGYLEALSFIALLGIAMPLKHVWGIREATMIPGLVHGLLWIVYLVLAYETSDEEKWPKRRLWEAFVASVLPLGTLIFDRRVYGPTRPQGS